MQELRVLRDRHASVQADIDAIDRGSVGGSRSMVAQTTTLATYPTSAQAFYACTAQDLDGPETEGASATLTAGSTMFVYNVGSAIPATGTNVIAHFVGGRWVMSFDG